MATTTQPISKTPTVAYRHPAYTDVLAEWTLVRDCVDGPAAIKAAGTAYLPKPNPSDTSEENRLRYADYLLRAVFYNVTAHTLNGLVGQVFTKPPVASLPKRLAHLTLNADGAGLGFEQLAKRLLQDVLSYGRSGLLVDYPTTQGATTVAAIASGTTLPTLVRYEPFDIINWRTKVVGSRTFLSLVVLCETKEVSDNGFQTRVVPAYRVLRLSEEGAYTVEVFSQTEADASNLVSDGVKTPLDADGKPFSEIPFVFIGSEANDVLVDPVPLYSLAALNVAHYRNSADYEESSYLTGQPTLVLTGLTEEWVTNVLKGEVRLGSRAAIPLPAAGDAKLVQAMPATMPKEAMDAKEKQMLSVGAKLVQQTLVQRTATEAKLEHAAETSILSSATKNVTAAIEAALAWAGRFVGTSEVATYKLNTDFAVDRLEPGDRIQLLAEWQANAISYTELRDNLRAGGVATQADEAAWNDPRKPLPPPAAKPTPPNTP